MWIDALIDFEGVLGRSSLLGVRWDSNTSQGELPVALLRGSTLAVLGEDPAWMVSGSEGFITGVLQETITGFRSDELLSRSGASTCLLTACAAAQVCNCTSESVL
jgi:hypothetical protein